MKLKNAKVGLRVQMKSTESRVPEGSVGTIVCVQDDLVWVHWYDDVRGWSDEEFSIPLGHGWAVDISDIRKFEE